MKKLVLRVITGLLGLSVLVYGGIIVYLIIQETNLVYYEAYGQPLRTVLPDSAYLEYQAIAFPSEDGVKLTGWILFSDRDSSTSPWILFCHGNASDISYMDYIARYKLFTSLGLNVMTFDYRGFGESEGEPSEEGLYKDVMASYKYLTLTKKIPSDKIILYGHSLGTHVAIDLATRVPAAALVVEGSYRSVPELAHQFYPYIPVRLVMRNRFMSVEKIGLISIPKLFIHSSEDEIIPISEGKALYEKALQPKSFLTIRGRHDPAPMESRDIYCNGLFSFLAGTTAHIESGKP